MDYLTTTLVLTLSIALDTSYVLRTIVRDKKFCKSMPGIVVKVDDRVILGTLISSIVLYLGLSWHRAYFTARSSLVEQPNSPDGADDGQSSPADQDATRASNLLELHFSTLHDTERPFGNVPAIQAAVQANDELASSIALLVERHCAALTDFTGEMEQPQALLIGCGVGGVAMALAQSFPCVLASDSSQRCIDAAKALQDQGCLSYKTAYAKGVRRLARVAPDIDSSRITFLRADAMAFVAEVEPRSTDALVVTDALTQLACPKALLAALSRLLRPNGIVCIATDYKWRASVTPPENQLSGADRGAPGRQLATVMEAAGFSMIAEQELAGAVRQSERCLELSMYQCTIWRVTTRT